MAPLRNAAKFDPFLSLDWAGVEGGGIKFCHLATLVASIKSPENPRRPFPVGEDISEAEGVVRGLGVEVEKVRHVQVWRA